MTTPAEHIHCLPCGATLSVNKDPVLVDLPGEGRRLVIPKLDAPFICESCREDPTKLKATRREMFKYIGAPQKQEGFDG